MNVGHPARTADGSGRTGTLHDRERGLRHGRERGLDHERGLRMITGGDLTTNGGFA